MALQREESDGLTAMLTEALCSPAMGGTEASFMALSFPRDLYFSAEGQTERTIAHSSTWAGICFSAVAHRW